jgi:uncharacterized membrane protein YjjP (DUF1212 family)
MLEMMGFTGQIKCFQGSQQALDFVFNHVLFTNGPKQKLELIITDSEMPIISGMTMIKEVNKLYESYTMTQMALQPDEPLQI